MPESTFSHTAVANADPARVWQSLQRAETWRGMARIDRVWGANADDAGNLVSFRWLSAVAGQEWEGVTRVTDSQPGIAMTLALESEEIEAEINVTIAPAGDSTRVRVDLAARSQGFLSGMFWPAVKDALNRGLVRQVEAFAMSFE